MADPTKYTPDYDFSDYQEDNPTTPLPANELDVELANIAASIDSVVEAIKNVRRSDGAVKNDSIGYDQLKDEVDLGINAPTTWLTATTYVVGQTVYQNNGVYRCLISHTSGVFSTDLAAGRWSAVVDLSGSVNAAAASASSASASASSAASSASSAATSASAADTAKTQAETARTDAQTAAAAAAASAAAGIYDAVQDVSANFSVVLADEGDLFRVNTASGNITATLPLISAVGDFKVAVAKITGDGNTVTINRSGSNTINGGTSYTLDVAYETVTLISKDGTTDWLAIGGGDGGSTFSAPDYFSGTGAQTAFTLTRNPGTENAVLISISGVVQPRTLYTVSGTTLTFSVAPPSGTNNIEVVYLGGAALNVGTPGDGTVTTAKIVDRAVTAAKISSDLARAYAPGGRLTLTSGVSVTSADVVGASTIFYTPHVGNTIPLFNGTNWELLTFTERSLVLSGLISGRPYDVFAYNNAGTVTLEILAWTNDTTRATALAYQDGVLVRSGSTTRRYLGTFYSTGTTTTEDSAKLRVLYNYYNRVDRSLFAAPSGTSYTYTTATLRASNNNTTYGDCRVGWISGLIEDPVSAHFMGQSSNTGGNARYNSIGLNSTSVSAGATLSQNTQVGQSSNPVSLAILPALGFNYLQMLEFSNATGTTTWYTGANGVAMTGSVKG
jgi:hypothetical protein